MINFALGRAELVACSSGDTDHDGLISIEELVTAVIRPLDGRG